MSVKGKLWMGYGLMTVLAAIMGAAALYSSFESRSAAEMVDASETKMIGISKALGQLSKAQQAHKDWINAINESIMLNKSSIDIVTDGHECGFGKWIYNKNKDGVTGPEAIESIDRDSSALFKSLLDDHLKLHKSAEAIVAEWQPRHPGLIDELKDRLDDHRSWALAVANSIIDNTPVTVETDPAKCKFGKFLAGTLNLELESKWPEYASIMKNVKKKHEQLHKSVIAINKVKIGSDNYREERSNIYENTTLKNLKEVSSLFFQLIGLEKAIVGEQQKAIAILQENTLPIAHVVQASLGKIESNFNKIYMDNIADNRRILNNQHQSLKKARNIIIGIFIILVVFSCTIAAVSVRSIVVPVRMISGGLSRLAVMTNDLAGVLKNNLAEGDWSVSADIMVDEEFEENVGKCATRNDELGEMCCAGMSILNAVKDAGGATNICIEKVNEAMDKVNSSVFQMVSSSMQISQAAQILSEDAANSASSLEEITATMTEIGTQTSTTAENTSEASRLASDGANAIDKGKKHMLDMTVAMDEIKGNSEQMQAIIKTIDSIAFQTNLLALNAAVEAARAGVHGKGFAVVAEEVRNLAGRSAKAASETATLIEKSNAQIANGVNISKSTAEALELVHTNASKTSEVIAEIAAAANEQALGIKQINLGLGQIDSVTQQNTSNAEETAASSEEMNAQANILKDQVDRFILRSHSNNGKLLPQTLPA